MPDTIVTVGTATPEPASEAPVPESPPAPSEGVPGADSGAAAPAETPEGEAEPALAPAELTKLERAKAAAEKAVAQQAARRARQAAEQRRQQETDHWRKQAERASQEAQQARELQELVRRDPVAAAKRIGLSPKQVAELAVREGTPEHAIEQLREENRRLAERQQQWEQREQQRQVAAQSAQAEQAFLAAADSDAYPHLQEVPPAILLASTREMLSRYSREDLAEVTDSQILAFLDRQFAEHKKTRSARSSANGPGGNSAGTPSVSTPSAKAGSATPRTLTNALSTQRAKAPIDFDSMDREEQKRVIADQIRQKFG